MRKEVLVMIDTQNDSLSPAETRQKWLAGDILSDEGISVLNALDE